MNVEQARDWLNREGDCAWSGQWGAQEMKRLALEALDALGAAEREAGELRERVVELEGKPGSRLADDNEELMAYFRNQDDLEGHRGDYRGDSAIRTAIRVLRERRERNETLTEAYRNALQGIIWALEPPNAFLDQALEIARAALSTGEDPT